MPTLSVVIPARNEEPTIARVLTALRSAVQTSALPCEMIVVDNCSTDQTAAIASRFGCRVVRDSSNTIAKLRNDGAKTANSEILVFLDADCVVDRMWISNCVEHFSNERIAVVGTSAIPDLKAATWVERAWYNLITGVARPDYPSWLGTSNLFVRRSVFEEVGGFDEKLETAEDVDFCRRVRLNHLIFHEKRLATIHLRESKTVYDLFRRERRRGRSTLRQFFKSNKKSKDAASLFVPLLMIFAILMVIISGALNAYTAVGKGAAGFLLLLPAVLMIKKKSTARSGRELLQTYLIASAYLLARSASLCEEIVVVTREMFARGSKYQ